MNVKRLWLIEERKRKGLTQEQVAKESRISRQYYAFIESGERGVPVHTAKKIAAVLGFDWKRFYDDSPDDYSAEMKGEKNA